jgi:hypothetical protein
MVQMPQAGEDFGDLHASSNHSVVIAANMPALRFGMAPAAAIEGIVRFANGDPAPGVSIQLVHRIVENGRRVWQMNNQTRTRAAGNFRFGNLLPGEYAVYTQPFLDTDTPYGTADEPDGANDAAGPQHGVPGYAAVYFPDARTPGELAPLVLTAGQTRQLTFTLTEESFHSVVIPVANRASGAQAIHASIRDAAGHLLEYHSRWNAGANSVVALLPDGNYQITLASAMMQVRQSTPPLVGESEFTVAGKPLTLPRVTLLPQQLPALAVNILGGSGSAHFSLAILANPATGWIEDGLVAPFARGPLNGPLEPSYTPPGSYWLQPQASLPPLCEASLTAAGASLAREPVQVAMGGSTPPLVLTFRADCARLTLHLPASVMSFTSGEEPSYTVYAVPGFDFTHPLQPITLRPTSGDSYSLEALTPGTYRVFTFAGAHPLAYHDPAQLARFHSQELTLQPGGSAELTLEVPGP